MCVCVFVCVSQSERRAECVSFILQFCLDRNYQLDNWSVFTEKSVREVEGQKSHTHTSTFTSSPPTLTLSSQVCVCLVGPCPVASVLSCHLLREDDFSFWLYLWMRGERECSLTKSSGNLYWGNIVSRKPSRKT